MADWLRVLQPYKNFGRLELCAAQLDLSLPFEGFGALRGAFHSRSELEL